MDVTFLRFDNECLMFSIEMEFFDEKTSTFINLPKVTIKMEHSLYTISKWESKHHKSFFSRNEKTSSELIDYIHIMIQEPEQVNLDLLNAITGNKSIVDKIKEYLDDTMTGTFFREIPKRSSSELVTSELLYYQMISYRIPVEFEHWHINRLVTLIKVFNIKNSPPKKRSMASIMRENDALNEARKKQLGTKG